MLVDPVAIREAWERGAAKGQETLGSFQEGWISGDDLGGLADGASWAADEMVGLLGSGRAILNETKDRLEACLDALATTDDQGAVMFSGVKAPRA